MLPEELEKLTLLQRIQRLEAIVEDVVEKSSKKKFVKPTINDVESYMKEKGMVGTPAFIQTEASKFINHYTSNGWKVGKNSMKDWKAAVRNWITNVKQGTYNGKNITGNFGQQPLQQPRNGQGGFGII